MQFDWRAISGPALTAATALIAILVDRHFIAVPNPAPLFVCIVAFAGSLQRPRLRPDQRRHRGRPAPRCSSSTTAPRPATTPSDLVRLSMLAITAAGTAAITGLLRKRLMDAFAWERRHHATAERLSAALDQVDIGIVLLDSDTRAEFINRAFRDYFSLSDEKADSKPPFIALMYHGRDTGAYELPEEELSAFIARRTEMMRVGRLHADQHQPRGRTGAAFQLHGIARRRTDAELHAGDRSRPSYRRSRQCRLLPVAARRRRSRPRPASARRGIAAGTQAVRIAIDPCRHCRCNKAAASQRLRTRRSALHDQESRNVQRVVTVRFVTRQDYDQWLPLWDGYNAFYGRSGATALAPEITAMTWARFFDAYEPVHAPGRRERRTSCSA